MLVPTKIVLPTKATTVTNLI